MQRTGIFGRLLEMLKKFHVISTIVVLGLSLDVIQAFERDPTECKRTPDGVDYRGKRNVSRSGYWCQKWSLKTPHFHDYHRFLPGDSLLHAENFCRNPGNETDFTPWCYTVNRLKPKWEECDIRLCSDGGCWGDKGGICQQVCIDGVDRQFECGCYPGFTLQADNVSCTDVDECSDGNGGCEYECSNGNGDWNCSCPHGYELMNKTHCQDFDECSVNNGGCDQKCINHLGNHSCACYDGYVLDPHDMTCRDINECEALDNGGCQMGCKNEDGGWDCFCEDGYTLVNGTACQDIDECSNVTSIECEQNCVNSLGSYSCGCLQGYTFDIGTNSCTDVNECEHNNGNCEHACNNTIGSHRCFCDEGYSLDSDNRKCTKITFLAYMSSMATTNVEGTIIAIIMGVVLIAVLIVVVINVLKKMRDNRSTDVRRLIQQAELKRFRIRKKGFDGSDDRLFVVDDESGMENGQVSYTNVAFEQIHSEVIKATDLPRIVEKIQQMPTFLLHEFKNLPLFSDTSRTDFARKSDLKMKNRFKTIMPYNENRVRLQELNHDPLTTYINASLIKGYRSSDKIIIAAGPSSATIVDFWRMVYEFNVSVIVMLTECHENDKIKCEKYWPQHEPSVYSEITVTPDWSEEWADHVIRKFTITKDQRTVQHVTQIQFKEWPDQGVPKDAVELLAIRRKVKRFADPGKYILVHCSAGVGRSGAYVAIDHLIEEAVHEGQLDVFRCVKKLRQQRMYSVQTLEQYSFIYRAVFEALTLGNSVTMSSDISDQMDRLKKINILTGKPVDVTEFTLLKEIHRLPKPEECQVALMSENKNKNRFLQYIPADRHRVSLKTPSDGGKSDYINAVFVQSHRMKNAYIVTQLPLSETVVDFWNMCIGYNCRTVLFLEREQEGNNEFLQLIPERTALLHLGSTQVVKLVSSQHEGPIATYATVVLQTGVDKIVCANSPVVASVTIIRVKLPPLDDQKDQTMIKAYQQVWNLHRQTPSPSKDSTPPGPIVVMCRNGVDPSGQYVATANMLDSITSESEVDVVRSVYAVRKTQPHFIQTQADYEDLYRTAQAYIKETSAAYANF